MYGRLYSFNGFVPCSRTSSPSLNPSSSESVSFGSVWYLFVSSRSVRPSPSLSTSGVPPSSPPLSPVPPGSDDLQEAELRHSTANSTRRVSMQPPGTREQYLRLRGTRYGFPRSVVTSEGS